MTREECKKIVRVAYAALSHGKASQEEIVDRVDAYWMFLQNYSYEEVSIALVSFMETSGATFVPSVAELIAEIKKLRKVVAGEDAKEMSEMTAWGIVRKAINNGIYRSEESFEAFPEEIKKVVESPRQISNWASDPDFNESVVQSNFMRSYRMVIEQKKQSDLIPDNVKKMMIGAMNNDRLGNSSKVSLIEG